MPHETRREVNQMVKEQEDLEKRVEGEPGVEKSGTGGMYYMLDSQGRFTPEYLRKRKVTIAALTVTAGLFVVAAFYAGVYRGVTAGDWSSVIFIAGVTCNALCGYRSERSERNKKG